jgi:uncharacterized phage-associated protein
MRLGDGRPFYALSERQLVGLTKEEEMDSEAVANYFIQKSFDTGIPLSQMKLLKLVYIAHGWHRGYFGLNLINDAVQAWRYGPVIPDLYRRINHYGRGYIDAPIDGFGIAGDARNPVPCERTLELLDKVWDAYCNYRAEQLSSITHQKGTPWDEVWNQEGGATYTGAIIPNDLIGRYYEQKINGLNMYGA